jgi:hypothetical protein
MAMGLPSLWGQAQRVFIYKAKRPDCSGRFAL